MSEESFTRSGYHHNWITYAGAAVMLLGFFGGLFLWILEFLSPTPAPYLGINYLVFTTLLVAGFFAVPIGMLRERRQRRARAGHERAAELRVDLSQPAHRYAALTLVTGAAVVLLLSGIGAYRSFQASESTSFCGQLCHSVMDPEWIAYSLSAHAKVKCVECHIGPGADWFVRSKLSGLRQIWATALRTYPRPIPTPIHDLRPARETCEECHWRRKFTGYKENERSYFLSDEQNTLHRVRMLVKIGGEKTAFMKGSGIHYHMLIAGNVEYVAHDERREEIAWVRVARRDGSVTEFENTENPLSEEQRRGLEVRTMDCMDCHNRPAHQFPSPMESVDRALEDGVLPASLPYLKAQAVKALDEEYVSHEEAMVGIANRIRTFYRQEYPALLERDGQRLGSAIQGVQEIYRTTIFPSMKAKWSAYPNHIGHLESPGCFRCHNEAMRSEDGASISSECNSCHIILAQGETTDLVNVNLEEGLPFVHPADGEPMDGFVQCSECHTGGAELY